MCESLTVDRFSMVDNPVTFDVIQVADNAEYRYILENDEYLPKDKHDTFSYYSITHDKICVTSAMLSRFQMQHFPTGKGTKKLVPNLSKPEKYVVHYRNLKLYLELEVIVTKVHCVVRFR